MADKIKTPFKDAVGVNGGPGAAHGGTTNNEPGFESIEGASAHKLPELVRDGFVKGKPGYKEPGKSFKIGG